MLFGSIASPYRKQQGSNKVTSHHGGTQRMAGDFEKFLVQRTVEALSLWSVSLFPLWRALLHSIPISPGLLLC